MTIKNIICNICVMDTSDPSITFDENGVCNHCQKEKKKLDKGLFVGEKGLKYLKAISTEIIAKGLIQNTQYEVLSKILLRKEDKASQTHKSRYQRFENIEGVFFIPSVKMLEGKHIILLDDVYTTGATISECIKTLQEIKDIRISVVCLAA